MYTSCLNTYPFLGAIPSYNIENSARKNSTNRRNNGEANKRDCSFRFFDGVCMGKLYIVQISSQIVFDSQENERDPNDFYSKDSLNLNQVNDRLATTRRIPKSFIFAINSENAFRMSNKKRSHFIQDDPTRQPAVINNIQIIVNENGTKSGIDVCKNGICNISVSSRLNNEGNIVTDVHLTVITKLETDFKTNDIPIVDGVRGVANTYDLGLRHLNRSRPSTYLYNTPQIQSRYQGGEPWYQGRRSFQRPRIKPVVDDKIEPPLSKTQWNKE